MKMYKKTIPKNTNKTLRKLHKNFLPETFPRDRADRAENDGDEDRGAEDATDHGDELDHLHDGHPRRFVVELHQVDHRPVDARGWSRAGYLKPI